LSFDADYICSVELAQEISGLIEDRSIAGYSVAFRYCVFGYPLRSTIYPDRIVLYQRALGRYRNEGHGHRLEIDGELKSLRNQIDHDDRKPLSRWIASQDKYSIVEAQHLLATNRNLLSAQDRLRLKVFYAPIAMLFYLLLGRGLILDGWRGWFYVAQRVIAECLLSLRLLIERHDLEKIGK